MKQQSLLKVTDFRPRWDAPAGHGYRAHKNDPECIKCEYCKAPIPKPIKGKPPYFCEDCLDTAF